MQGCNRIEGGGRRDSCHVGRIPLGPTGVNVNQSADFVSGSTGTVAKDLTQCRMVDLFPGFGACGKGDIASGTGAVESLVAASVAEHKAAALGADGAGDAFFAQFTKWGFL